MNRKDLPAPNAKCVVCDHEYYRCKKCIELRTRGIEAWRINCDCYECYQIFALTNEYDVRDITRDMYERVKNIEMPEGKKINAETQKKLDEIGKTISEREREAEYKKLEAQKAEITKAEEKKSNENNWKYGKREDKKDHKTFNGYNWHGSNKDVK